MFNLLLQFSYALFELAILAGFIILLAIGTTQIYESNNRVWNGNADVYDYMILSAGFD